MYKIFQTAIISILCDQLSKLSMLYVFDLPNAGKIDVFPPYLQRGQNSLHNSMP